MKIVSMSYKVPSQQISNNDIIDYLLKNNPNVNASESEIYLKFVKKLLEKIGANTRYWRDIEGGEKASSLILQAMDNALYSADMKAQDIDLLIYCGVGKGFIEPANAYFYANLKGMKNTNCFDITDACMSWVRALETVYLMLNAGHCKKAMIINGEFHLGLHDNWKIRSLKSLEYAFPAYTIGEAATATILTKTANRWEFNYSSHPEFVSFCTIPLEGYSDFVEPDQYIGSNGINRFTSYGRILSDAAESVLGPLIQKTIDKPDDKAWYFPHAPSKSIYQNAMPKYGISTDNVYLKVFPKFGNLVSASLPVGLSMASEEKDLKRGDSIALVPASAGLVASVVQFVY